MSLKLTSSIGFLLSLLFFSSETVSSKSSQCLYKDYAPGGTLPEIDEISVKSAVKFQSTVLQDVRGYFDKGGSVTAATLGVMEAFGKAMKFSPHVAASIGAFSVALGFVSPSPPSPDEILKKAHESVLLLQEEVNVRLDQMKDYVDTRVIDLDRKLMMTDYMMLNDKWATCVREESLERADRCQRDAERTINSYRFKFQQLHKKFANEKYTPFFYYRYVATWQWMQSHKTYASPPSYYEIRELEAGLIPFRDYATLHLIVLKTLAESYKADKTKCRSYKLILEKLIKEADFYDRYVKWAYEWIYIRQFEENMYFGVPRRAGGGPASAKRGGFLGTIECSNGGSKCEVECSQMFKDNKCVVGSRREASEACEKNMLSLKKDLVDFWTTNVLDFAKEWVKYGESAKQDLDALGECNNRK